MKRILSSALIAACLVTACGDDETTTAATSTATSGGGGAGVGSGGAMATGGGAVAPHPQLPPPDLGSWTGEDAPVLTPAANLPSGIADADAVHYSALSCGPHAENLFDLVVPNGASGDLPLILYIHGGGFLGGSRLDSFEGGRADDLKDYLDAGFAYATIDYRFVDDADANGVGTSLQDSMVCFQYIRHHASTLGIDPDRVVAAGGSAGAGTALWFASSDDMGDPSSSHAILRESTRTRGSIIDATQATYDVLSWTTAVYAPEYEQLMLDVLASGAFDERLAEFYGISMAELDTLDTDPALLDYRAAVDMLSNVSADDPPIWASSPMDDTAPVNTDVIFHHPFHVRAIIAAAEPAGVEVVATAQALGLSANETRVAFATRVTAE